MQPRLLDLVACPDCRSHELRLRKTKEHRDEKGQTDIEEGSIVCSGCGEIYPIREGIARMIPSDLRQSSGEESGERVEGVIRTARGYDIHHLRTQGGPSQDKIIPSHRVTHPDMVRRYFRDYLSLEAHDLQSLAGQIVLDAGCGDGRFMSVVHESGTTEVVGVDVSIGGLLHARRTFNDVEGFHLIQGDITRPPLRPGIFDTVYSIGVIHHLANPREGFRALESLLSPEGRLWIWVYGLTGMSWTYRLSHLVWLRRLTRTWSLEAKFHLCRWLALLFRFFYLFPLRFAKKALPNAVLHHLPFSDLISASYEDVVYAVFDRLQPPYTHYLQRRELEGWLTGFDGVSVEAPRKRGWVVKGEKPRRETSSPV